MLTEIIIPFYKNIEEDINEEEQNDFFIYRYCY
jgi:hypothetical protein